MINEKLKKIVILTILLMQVTTQSSYAHKGNTDSNGGHKDNKNVSGLGTYHYHCGGNPPHLHSNQICPYQKVEEIIDDETIYQHEPVIQESDYYDDSSERLSVEQEGYNIGFKAGAEGYSANSNNNSKYPEEFKSGYEKGYDQGKNELSNKIKIAYDEGVLNGRKGEAENNTYSMKVIKDSYTNGYRLGRETYIEENKPVYLEYAIEDASKFEKRNFDDTIPYQLKEEYLNAYNKQTSNLKDIAKKKGFKDYLIGETSGANSFKYKEEIDSYNEGINYAKNRIEKESIKAYEYGYSKKNYTVPKELKVVEKILLEAYYSGEEEIKKKELKIILMITLILILFCGAGVFIILKKRNK